MRSLAWLILPAAVLAAPLAAQTIRPERTAFAETSSHDDVLAFLDSLQARGAGLRIWSLTRSPEGREVPVVLAARPMVSGADAAHRTGKPIVYIQANIHAGEVEGKEAAQMLLRDLTLGSLRPLLDSVILRVVPIYNADGNEQLAPQEINRPEQNGPPRVGRRANGQGLDLNRDYVKLEAPETRASEELLDRRNPDLFIDRSLANLRVDSLDLVQLQCPPTEVLYRQEVFAAFGPEKNMQIYGRGLRRRLPPMLGGDQERLRMVPVELRALAPPVRVSRLPVLFPAFEGTAPHRLWSRGPHSPYPRSC